MKENEAHYIYIYTLLLDGGFYYVGKTVNPEKRYQQHIKEKGAKWTMLHRPVERIMLESFLVLTKDDEDKWEDFFTIKMMRQYGWERVRGGRWCMQGVYELIRSLQHSGYFTDIDVDRHHFIERTVYTYILQLENNKYYLGRTENFKKELELHGQGKLCRWTRENPPVEVLYCKHEVFNDGKLNSDEFHRQYTRCLALYGSDSFKHTPCFLKKQHHYQTHPLLQGYKGDVEFDIHLSENEQLYYVFVLELDKNKYHISYSASLNALLYKLERGKSSLWCRQYKPVAVLGVAPVIVLKSDNNVVDFLDPVVDRYFNLFGHQNVRGGRFQMIEEALHDEMVRKKYDIVDGSYIRKNGY